MSEGACDVRRLLSSKKGEDGEGGGVSFDLFIAICVKINLLLRNNIYFFIFVYLLYFLHTG